MIVCGVDTAKKDQAAASIDTERGGRLIGVGTGRDIYPLIMLANVLVVEMPDRVWAGTTEDLIHVARGGQKAITWYESLPARRGHDRQVVEVPPAGRGAWKAPIKKWTHHTRVWAKLPGDERETFADYFGRTPKHVAEYLDKSCAGAALANSGKVAYGANFTHALDALGIALHHGGYIKKTGLRTKLK